MHELSIARGIVDIATREVQKAKANKVDEIVVEIGALAGVEMEALDFAWDVAVKDTVLYKAERRINHIPGEGSCPDCGEQFEMQTLFDACPSCSNYFINLLKGKELKVKSLVVS